MSAGKPPGQRPGAAQPQRPAQRPASACAAAAAPTAQKRPTSAGTAQPAKKPNTVGPLTLIVYSLAVKDEIGIDTLVGDYVEAGTNHGKKFFKRRPVVGAEADLPVFLYFWDTRDGADFGGWWFGDQVGGSQVWSRCEKADALPPKEGWRIPWDGPVQADLVVEPKPAKLVVPAKQESKQEAADEADLQGGTDERIQRATDRVVIAEIEATQALESVHAMVQGEVTEDGLRVVEEMLRSQAAAMTEAHKVLAADIMDARKTAPKSVTTLNSLTPRLRIVQASLAQEMKNTKQLVAQKKQEAEELKQRAREEEQQMQAEQRDAKLLEEALPGAMEVVTQAEDLIDAVHTAASPLPADLADGMSESANAMIRETEAAVIKARDSIKTARMHLQQKVTAAKNYATEARKVALSEYSTLQEKLNELQKRLTPFAHFRQDFQKKLEDKKVVSQLEAKLGAAELEVDQVMAALSGEHPPEEQVKSSETTIPAALATLTSILRVAEQRLQTAQGSLKSDLAQMQERAKESKRKLESFRVELQGQLEQLQVRSLLQQGLEKTQAAEEALSQTSVAEAPFLKGEELLPAAEASDAIVACREAARVSEAQVGHARAFLKAKQLEVKRLPENTRASASEELSLLSSRVEVVAQKLATFKRELAARETGLLLQEAALKVAEAEAKVQGTAAAAEPLAGERLEELSIERLKEVTEQTLEAEKLAAVACGEARKALLAKQKDSQVKDAASFGAELNKLQLRLSAALQELGKQRKAAVQGEKHWKGKLLAQEKDEQMMQVEADVEKMELLSTPLGDEKPSDESIKELAASIAAAQAMLADLLKSVEPVHQSAQGGFKGHLARLLTRGRKAQQKLDEMHEATKEQRERVTCEAIVEEARSKLAKVDLAFQHVGVAEMPYLMGMEVLPTDETAKAVADCESAAAGVQQAITEARSFLGSKLPEVGNLTETVAVSGRRELDALSKRLDEAAEKLTQFRRETEGRKRVALRQEALAKVADAEEAVQETIVAAAPLSSQNLDEMSAELASSICEKLSETERHAQEKLDTARQFLLERQKDKKVQMDAAELSKMVGRLNTVQVDLAKAKAAASEHEQRFVSKLLLQEAADMMQELEAELESTTEAAAPLLVEGGKDFVVASMTKMILEALNEHVQKAASSREELFAGVALGAADGRVSEAEFLAFLERVPELCSRPDLSFSPEQRAAIFQQVDADKDGTITKDEFMALFRDRFICVSQVSVTDGFDISSSKTLEKLEVDDVVESLAEPKTHDTLGITRLEVKVLKDGTSGWVTMQGNQGTAYLSPFTAYAAFMKNIEKALTGAAASATKAAKFLSSKSAELRECKVGPLADAKGELSKLRPKLGVLQAKLDQLKKRIEEGKQGHSKREEYERKKQEDKKDRKAASLVLKAVTERVDAAKAALPALEQAASPMLPSSEGDLASVAAPLSVRTATVTAAEELTKAVSAARETLATQQGRVAKAAKGPWFETRQEMAKLHQQLDELQAKARSLVEQVTTAVESLAAAKRGKVSDALRTSLQTRAITPDALFAELAGAGGDHVPAAALGAYLEMLPGLSLAPEQKQLIFDQADGAGLSRRRFFQMLERYYKCVKDIAITSDFDIKTSNTLRKIEVGEVVEVLEGPKRDESLGLMRVRARALSDGKVGWITGKGNQGTPFLQETSKPSYFVVKALALQEGFASEESAGLRELQAHEVLEVLEGPRKEVVGNAVRARGKATSDGASGWFTVKSRQGETLAEPGKSIYRCTQSIAITDGLHIKECQVLRKVEKGEGLLMLEGPADDETAGVSRIRARAMKDGLEGWVTTKGNAGSTYAEESRRTLTILRSAPLQSGFASDGSATVRTLAEGEILEVLDGPREERCEPAVRLRCRAVADGRVGWVTLASDNLRPWSPVYRCVNGTVLGDALSVSASKPVRRLEPEEELELIEGPRHEADVSVLRIKCKATKDGAVGWATIAGNQGKPFLEPAAAE